MPRFGIFRAPGLFTIGFGVERHMGGWVFSVYLPLCGVLFATPRARHGRAV